MGIKVNGKTLKSDEIGQQYRRNMNNVNAARAEEESRKAAMAATKGNTGKGKTDADAKAAEEARKAKLAEIMALPEEERIGALLDAGFNEEAAEETKRQAETNGNTADANKGDAPADEAKDDAPADANKGEAEKPAKKGKKTSKE